MCLINVTGFWKTYRLHTMKYVESEFVALWLQVTCQQLNSAMFLVFEGIPSMNITIFT